MRFEPIDAIEANVMYQHMFNHIQSYSQVQGPGSRGRSQSECAGQLQRTGYCTLQYRGVQSYPDENYTTTTS